MNEFKKYRRSKTVELRPYIVGESMADVSIALVDRQAGSPKVGDMIARNPTNHADQWLVAEKYFAQWLVAEKYFADNFEEI